MSRKPMLPVLDALVWGENNEAADAELRAAEDELRALDKVELVPGRAADRLIAAVARLYRATGRATGRGGR